MNCIIRCASLAACALAAGCGGEEWQVATHPATGRITINGEAPAGALVQLHSIGGKVDERDSRPWGKVREDGTYSLSTYETGEGAPPGTYAITVTWPTDPKVPFAPDRLKYKYSRPEQSKWQATIKEGENEIPTIEIAGASIDDPGKPSKRRGPSGPPMMPEFPAKRQTAGR